MCLSLNIKSLYSTDLKCVAQSRGNEMYKSNKQQTKITSDLEKTHGKYLFLFMFQCSIIQPAKTADLFTR